MVAPSNAGPDDDDRRTRERRAGLLEFVTANDQKHDEAHKRIRQDVRDLEQRCEDGQRLFADRQHALMARVDALEKSPVDVSKVMFAPRVVFAIIAVVLSVSVGMWATTSGLRSDVRDILTRMSTEQRVSDANAKLLETNNATIRAALADNTREMKASLETISKRQDLLTLQYNELNSQITRLTARGER